MELLGFPFTIANSLGWYSFASVFILFLLYLIKPKPIKKVIPSLIFLKKSKKKKNITSFFKRFIPDLLMLFQLLILIFLSSASLLIFTYLHREVQDDQIVWVLDVSASSLVQENGRTRFQKAVDMIENNLAKTNSLITAGAFPRLAAEKVDASVLKETLAYIEPKHTASNIWDSILMAESAATSTNAKIIVLSDFRDTSSRDPLLAKDILTSKGYDVSFINTGAYHPNIGIVDAEIKDNTAHLDVKNFGQKAAMVTIGETEKEINPGSIDSFEVGLKPGTNEIQLKNEDAFPLDNLVYLINPLERTRKVLVLGEKKDSFVWHALTSIPYLDVSFTKPPIFNLDNIDLLVIDKTDLGKLLPGTIKEIKQKVEGGMHLIIIAQEGLATISQLLPVEIVSKEEQESFILNDKALPSITDISFGKSKQYLNVKPKYNGTLILASTQTDIPVITLSSMGRGKVLFYGIFDDANNFKLSTDYPVFWIVISYELFEKMSSRSLNLRTGNTVSLSSEVKGPDNRVYKEPFIAETIGVYESSSHKVAVNLLDERESQITPLLDQADIKTSVQRKKTDVKFGLMPILVFMTILALFGELIYSKRRGDF